MLCFSDLDQDSGLAINPTIQGAVGGALPIVAQPNNQGGNSFGLQNLAQQLVQHQLDDNERSVAVPTDQGMPILSSAQQAEIQFQAALQQHHLALQQQQHQQAMMLQAHQVMMMTPGANVVIGQPHVLDEHQGLTTMAQPAEVESASPQKKEKVDTCDETENTESTDSTLDVDDKKKEEKDERSKTAKKEDKIKQGSGRLSK